MTDLSDLSFPLLLATTVTLFMFPMAYYAFRRVAVRDWKERDHKVDYTLIGFGTIALGCGLRSMVNVVVVLFDMSHIPSDRVRLTVAVMVLASRLLILAGGFIILATISSSRQAGLALGWCFLLALIVAYFFRGPVVGLNWP